MEVGKGKGLDSAVSLHLIVPKQEESEQLREPLSDQRWQEILLQLDEELITLDQELIRSLAMDIREKIEWLDATMSRYCDITCLWCEDACCKGNKIFYNRADLLYLIALGEDLPPGQTRCKPLQECRYLGLNGCRMPRKYRPYVCVWYLCDAQMSIFQVESALFQRKFISVMQDIRIARIRLESLYERSYPT